MINYFNNISIVLKVKVLVHSKLNYLLRYRQLAIIKVKSLEMNKTINILLIYERLTVKKLHSICLYRNSLCK